MPLKEIINKSRRGKSLSRISYYVRTYGSPVVAIAILALLSGNLAATARMKSTLDELLDHGLVEMAPQKAVADWVDKNGIGHRIETPRMQGETDKELTTRHVSTVEAFHAALPSEWSK